jgi:hypothetical protein
MITKRKENEIGVYIDGNKVFYFHFDTKCSDDERKIAGAILSVKANKKQVADALWEQLHSEMNTLCRTELVKEIFIDVSEVYYPVSAKGQNPGGSSPRPTWGQNEINMDFYTDYLVQHVEPEGRAAYDEGFYCCETLGRFSRKDKKFYEISNNMLSKCEIM